MAVDLLSIWWIAWDPFENRREMLGASARRALQKAWKVCSSPEEEAVTEQEERYGGTMATETRLCPIDIVRDREADEYTIPSHCGYHDP